MGNVNFFFGTVGGVNTKHNPSFAEMLKFTGQSVCVYCICLYLEILRRKPLESWIFSFSRTDFFDYLLPKAGGEIKLSLRNGSLGLLPFKFRKFWRKNCESPQSATFSTKTISCTFDLKNNSFRQNGKWARVSISTFRLWLTWNHALEPVFLFCETSPFFLWFLIWPDMQYNKGWHKGSLTKVKISQVLNTWPKFLLFVVKTK